MNFNQAQELDAVFNLYETVKLDTDGNPDGSGSLVDFPVPLTAFLRKLAADVAALDGSAEGGISEDRLRQVIREEIARTRLS